MTNPANIKAGTSDPRAVAEAMEALGWQQDGLAGRPRLSDRAGAVRHLTYLLRADQARKASKPEPVCFWPTDPNSKGVY